MEKIYVIETIEALPGKTTELGEELFKIGVHARKEEGCLFYDLYQDKAQPHIFALVMCFKNQDAYDKHISAPFIQKFEEKFGKVLYQNVIENHYRKIPQSK